MDSMPCSAASWVRKGLPFFHCIKTSISPDRSVCGAHRLLSVAFQFGCRMDRQLDGAAPPSGGPRAEPETAAVYGHGIGRGSGADRRTSPEWGRWICLPGPAAWPASVCRRLRRRAGRSPAHHPGERIARLRREFPGLERTLTLARVVVGAARVGGDRAAELQRVLCARPVVGDTCAEPGYDRPQEAGSRTVERTLAAPGPVFVASVSRLTTPARTGALPNRRPPRR